MTDKQIINEKDLDTRCPYHCNEKIRQCNNSSQETPHTYCIDNKDCIYKLYARKEQECEKAKQNAQDTYDLWQALIESFNILQGEKIKLEQECESWKALINEAQLEQRKLEQQLDQLKAENEKLKKQLESTKGLVTVGNKQLMEALFELQKQQHENCHFDKIKELTKEM